MEAVYEPPPQPGLYVGDVMHHRLRPFRHRFVYRVFTLLLDLDRPAEKTRRSLLFGHERPRLLSFRARDHGPRDGSPLRPWVERKLRLAGIGWRPATILLLAFPRLLGYVFNPLSIYYCYRADGRLGAVLHEVKNTFGEQHTYALAVDPGRPPGGMIRQACGKDFYVSPFIEMDARYRFRLSEPGERLAVVIEGRGAAGAQMVASMTLGRRELTDRTLLAVLARTPLMACKVIAAIHVEAIRLWWKGARVQPQTRAPSASPAPVPEPAHPC